MLKRYHYCVWKQSLTLFLSQSVASGSVWYLAYSYFCLCANILLMVKVACFLLLYLNCLQLL